MSTFNVFYTVAHFLVFLLDTNDLNTGAHYTDDFTYLHRSTG